MVVAGLILLLLYYFVVQVLNEHFLINISKHQVFFYTEQFHLLRFLLAHLFIYFYCNASLETSLVYYVIKSTFVVCLSTYKYVIKFSN